MKAHLTRPVTQKEIINEEVEKAFYALLDQRKHIVMDLGTLMMKMKNFQTANISLPTGCLYQSHQRRIYNE